jgi:hypothetical protein
MGKRVLMALMLDVGYYEVGLLREGPISENGMIEVRRRAAVCDVLDRYRYPKIGDMRSYSEEERQA